MSISFNQVPANVRVPFLFAEFDSSRAQQGSAQKIYKALMFGQKLAAGSAAADAPVAVTNEAQAITLFGRGSMLHRMVKQFLANNKFTGLTVIPQVDPVAGALASGSISVTGPATSAGTISLLIGGQKVQVGVSSGDSADAIATAINAKINAAQELLVTSAAATNVVTLTARHKGSLGNGIDVRHSYHTGEALPSGVALAVTAMTGGASAPDLAAAIGNMTETQFDAIAFPYNDSVSLSAIEAELTDRWGPSRQNDGMAYTCKSDTHSNLVTFGNGRNSKHVSCLGVEKFPNPSFEIASAYAAVAAYYLQQDPARPLQTLPLNGILAPSASDEFTMQERNLLLFDGIAACKAIAGTVQIDRAITMYQVNAAGADDTAYLDVCTVATLSFIRWDWRNHMMGRYPRHKLASDGARYGAGQAIITPKVGRAEAIAKFRQWEEAGLVEGVDQFKRDLIVERNSSDPNRLDFLLSPDLVNQLTVIGTQIGFLL